MMLVAERGCGSCGALLGEYKLLKPGATQCPDRQPNGLAFDDINLQEMQSCMRALTSYGGGGRWGFVASLNVCYHWLSWSFPSIGGGHRAIRHDLPLAWS